MLQADIMRYVYTLAAAGVEVMRIACLMDLWHTRMLKLLDGEPAVILIVAVEPEDFDFEGNLNGEL